MDTNIGVCLLVLVFLAVHDNVNVDATSRIRQLRTQTWNQQTLQSDMKGQIMARLPTVHKDGYKYYAEEEYEQGSYMRLVYWEEFVAANVKDGNAQLLGVPNNNIKKRIAANGLISMLPDYANEKEDGSVEYFKDQTLADTICTMDNDKNILDSKGKKLTVKDALFIWDKAGTLRVYDSNNVAKYRHSSLSGGAAVFMAGEISVSAGVVTKISNKSGHYKPPILVFHKWLKTVFNPKVLHEKKDTPVELYVIV